MKKRWVTVVLLLLVLLAVGANTYVYLTTHAQPRFKIDSDNVVRIELTRYDLQTWTFGEGLPKLRTGPGGKVITIREDIELVCDVLSTLFVREYPFDEFDEKQHELLISYTYTDCMIFYLRDGSTRTLPGAFGPHARINDHWCYISSGKKYGYKPVFKVLNDVYLRARYIK